MEHLLWRRSQSIILQHHWRTLNHFRRFEKFYADLEKGDLAAYSFIEPRYLSLHEWKATDQHPPHDVRLGEPEETRRHRALLRTDALEKWRRGEVEQAEISREPLSTFQEALVGLAHLLNKKAHGKARTAPMSPCPRR